MNIGKRATFPRVRSLALALHAAWGMSAFALPDGASVVNGQVSIAQPGAGAMQINASNGAIINWRQFSIGASESTQFVQPSSTSAVLNRVVGRDLSELLGQLKSNGQVFLINPNGIVIGGAARIDTNSFVASTLDLSDADFLAGKLRFLARPGAGAIRNEGMITAGPGGRIALIAPDIENSGIIHAPDGNILLAAGRKLEITSLDLDGIRFEIQAPTDSVLNLGQLLADNGAVRVFAGSIRHSGEIRANRMAVDADGSIVLSGRNSITLTRDSVTRADGLSGGNILVQGGEGTARVQGIVSASGASGTGGDIHVLGTRVALESSAQLIASGSAAGGQILVGGDFQGANAQVQNAARVFVGEGAKLNADATGDGNGGRVIVWADENTRFGGDLSARGGPQGGNGGFAEVSGKANLAFTGSADLRSSHGANGSLLLDPLDILVSLTSGILPIVVDEFADFASNVVTISPLTLAAVGGNVVLQAVRDIYVRDAIALTTAGAGLTMMAGGAMFDSGSIFNTTGITTTAGAVTLRANSITGPGGITTAGGAVDLMTADSLNYTGAISSGGGAVTLASTNGSVFNADVDAGAGTIQATGSSVSSGSYSTSGTASLTATAGNVFINALNAGVANLNATSSINGTVLVTDRINATSTGSSVTLNGVAGGPLRLGTISAASNVILTSSSGMEQAAGGGITAPFVRLDTNNSTGPAGSQAAPILIASPSGLVQPRLELIDIASPTHVTLTGAPMLDSLEMRGTVAGLAAIALTGAANLTTLSLADGGGVLVATAVSNGGLANGFSLSVTNGALNAATLTLPGAPVDLFASTAVTVGTMTGASLSINAPGAVTIGSATTTASSGIDVSTGSCDNDSVGVCATSSPIVAGTLTAGGTGSLNLNNRDNGDVTVTSLTAGGDVEIDAGGEFETSFNFPRTSHRTANNIVLGTVVVGESLDINNQGQGNVSVTSMAVSRGVFVQAGGSFSPSAFVSQLTNNTITIGNAEPVGAANGFTVRNNGVGNLTLTGAVDRSVSGGISLSADQGSLSATGNLTARDSISVSVRSGAATLGQLSAGVGSNGDVEVEATGNIDFTSIRANGVNSNFGNVSLDSFVGSVRTTLDNAANDISATGNVSVIAGSAIGDALFARPLDIIAGAAESVTLNAGTDIGRAIAPVNIDTSGTVDITSGAGQFHVAATDGMVERSLSTIRLSASAAGIGIGNASTFTSADLDVTASSDGAVITVGDLVRSAGALDLFSFTATGASGLAFGNVNLATTGLDRLSLSAGTTLTQASPMTNSINANSVDLASGAALSAGAIATLGTNRSNFNGAIPDQLVLNAGGDILVAGGLDSLTFISVESFGGNLAVTGAVTGTGTSRNAFRAVADRVSLRAAGDISTGGAVTSATLTSLIAGGSISVGGAGIAGGVTFLGGNSQTDIVTVTAGMVAQSITTQAITGGFDKTVSGDTLNVAGGITGAARTTSVNANTLNTGVMSSGTALNVTGTTFNTGNLSALSGSLTVDATATYAPGTAVNLSANNVTIIAPDGISLTASGATVTAPTVQLITDSGNILADGLVNTTSLTLSTGGVFDVRSNAALSNVVVSADGGVAGAGAGSRVRGNGVNQLLTYVATGNQLALQLASDTGMTDRYTETSTTITDIVINTTGTFGAAGNSSVDVFAPSANIAANAVAMGNGSLILSAGGNIVLTSVVTGGGFVSVDTINGRVDLTSVNSGGGSVTAQTSGDANQHVNVEQILSLGGSVALTADNGNIVRVGAQPFQIDTRDGNGAASGVTTLNASNGSVGSAAAPILTRGAVGLVVSARDEIEVDLANAALTQLSITTSASGTGAVSVNDIGGNFSSLILSRSGPDLLLGLLSPAVASAFALTATDGNIVVGGDIGNITTLTLDAGSGFNAVADLRIQASGGPRTIIANTYDLRAGQDIVIAAGATAGESVSVAQAGAFGNSTLSAGRDILVSANAGSASVQHITPFATQVLNAGRDIRVVGGSAGVLGALANIGSTGSQSLSAGNLLLVQGGATDGAAASVQASQSQNSGAVGNVSVLGGGSGAAALLQAGTSQTVTSLAGNVIVQGGSGASASAAIQSISGSQSIGTTVFGTATDLVLVQGGTGNAATASIRSGAAQTVQSSGDIRVLGGSGVGALAEIFGGTSQSVGSTTTFSGNTSFDPTANILVQAGSGGTAGIRANNAQTIRASETISVLGGSAAGMTAVIESINASQDIGNASNFRNDPTGNILVQGGTASGAFASVKAQTNQTIRSGGSISVVGGAGAGASGEIRSVASSQTIGSTSNSSNDATDSVLVQAGTGGIARILAQGSQTILTSENLSVVGGSGAGMKASIESTAGFQSIGNTSTSFGNDPSGSILVQAGNGVGSEAFIKADTGQTIDAGGNISLIGAAANAFAEIVTNTGTQTIGNVSSNRDRTDDISLTGGSASGAYARIMSTAGFQSLRTSANLTLAGGAGDDAGATLLAGTGQNMTVQGTLAMVGGSGSVPGSNETAIRNNTSGQQSINVTGNMSVTGGGFGSDTWVKQNGTGNQSITVGGNLALLAPAATTSTGVTSIESLGPIQTVFVGGGLTIDNQAGWLTYIGTSGAQSITADTIAISLSSASPVTNPFAGISATGNQTINLQGDGATIGTATLSIVNTSSLSGSSAAIKTAADQVILMDYDSAGLVQIGSTNGLGKTEISAGGKHTLVAGQLLIQGGASSAATAGIFVPNDAAVISTIYGPIELKGGALGAAIIDPPQLDMVSNSGVFLLAGAGAGATASIQAGIFNLAATSGDLSLINSAAALASINADVFNFFGAGNVNLNGGTITVTQAGAITIPGICFSCDTNLIGPFKVSAFIPPPLDFGAFATSNVLALADLGVGLFDAWLDEDGSLVLSNRRLNQCY